MLKTAIVGCLTVFWTLVNQQVCAQNLVYNPSFELGENNCLFTISDLDFSRGATGWSMPTNGTSDVFSTQIPNKNCWASMPNGGNYTDLTPHIGTQSPRTGNRFTGIYTFSFKAAFNQDPEDSNYREYMHTELQSSLVMGEYYCGEMYVSLAEHPRFAANNLGMHLGDTPIRLTTRGPLYLTPQVVEKNVIIETQNWYKISGYFKATSPAKFLTIGNFNDNSQTIAVDKGGTYPNAYSYNYAYYFIDDVSVSILPRKSFTFSGDTIICSGDTTEITASGGLEEISWADLTDTTRISGTGEVFRANPETTTSYLVRGKNCKFPVRDTVTIWVKPLPEVELGKDTTICAGASILLDAGAHMQINWQNNSTSQHLNVNEPGDYSVIVKNEFNCSASDRIAVKVSNPPTVNLGKDALACENFPELKAFGNHNVEWSDGSQQTTFTPHEAGTYWVKVSNECGVVIDSIKIDSFEDIFIPNVLTLNGDALNAQLKITGIGDYVGQLNIFNRWGQSIYKDNAYEGTWPALNDESLSGIYYYTFQISTCPAYKGWVQIVR